MVEFPVHMLDACKYSETPSNLILFNSKELNDYLWIRLPKLFTRLFDVVDISEMISEETKSIEDLSEVFKENIWVKIPVNILNVSIGMHIYSITLQRKECYQYEENRFVLYFSYMIQDDNPDKPYVYMK